jgi:NAD(P)-dependent dehydrogenase (short-subunit alcohol dehydrogenase family)
VTFVGVLHDVQLPGEDDKETIMTTTDMERFAGKVAFVTGAGGGIGRATALAFAREGASVVVADLDERANQETAHLITKAGGRAIAVRCDVTRTEDVKAALDTTVETFGGLDVAFNNAGIEQPTTPAAGLRRRGRLRRREVRRHRRDQVRSPRP